MNEQNELTQQITTALEAKPLIAVPDDFSARLMAALPQKNIVRLPQALPEGSHYGQRVTLAMLAFMLLGMVAAAALLGRSGAWSLAEDFLFLQFGTLTLWFVLSRRRVF
ncbi:hypothetical protein Terro_2492 [Terriglobus roseus DSM 18391]|uniref:Uncharacterized protein n=1 Tax=Terriglobus roseus (strain DSM 18391 / NRRL B-41598 / KBS 63) TaxID=926566 RepID=I3ZGN1_TERRK|nr:hypothetical protein [Terriglobus roseus]AFL88399.1 hypothetical protein Terro_2128 [Terriglobus roseus DSM 18391]AFL88740.1 hypothetical protein Terro_2492 [Terriglobus roseus DSM 18391]